MTKKMKEESKKAASMSITSEASQSYTRTSADSGVGEPSWSKLNITEQETAAISYSDAENVNNLTDQ